MRAGNIIMAISVMQQPTPALQEGMTAALTCPGPRAFILAICRLMTFVLRDNIIFPIVKDHFIFFAATLPFALIVDRRGQAQKMATERASTTREGGRVTLEVSFSSRGRRRRWEPPWVLSMQRKRPNTRNITLTRAGEKAGT